MENSKRHPMAGSITGEYFVSDDGSVRVPALMTRPAAFPKVREDLVAYTWNDSDFLLASYPKNGTNFIWEIMTMLVKGSANYANIVKGALMIDIFPIGESSQLFPSPRVLNTHYRTDVLPQEFRKGKTVAILRNPKDVCVSWYYDMKNLASINSQSHLFEDMNFSQYLPRFLHDKDAPYGTYFDFVEYMWSLRNNSNILIVFYEDLKLDPLATIQKLNEFMETNRSIDLIQQIAEATSFDKMKEGKLLLSLSKDLIKLEHADNEKGHSLLKQLKTRMGHIYRKGGIGDWKNHFTVAANKKFDDFLRQWEGGKSIPFKY
ncbi:sulfotransferase 1C2-like [Watersipora subatra]|uniref:sulfotransferase 1C2-like n=1 Tax=Watersipora subatra TaxID=2589382 RepID=UPI00355B4868